MSSSTQVDAVNFDERAICPCCADLDIRDPLQWMRGTSRLKDGFEHRFCTRTVSRRDMGYYAEMGCSICAAFLESIAELGGEEISIRLFFGEGIDIFTEDYKSISEVGVAQSGIDWNQLGTFEGDELGKLLAGFLPSQSSRPASTTRENTQKKEKPSIPAICPSIRSETVLSFVTKNLEVCLREHAPCQQPNSTLPRRVIEVGTTKSASIKLLEPKHETTSSYIALSYCWGKGISVTTTMSTIDKLKSGVDIAMLPKTLQDAVIFTRSLGVSFLWVDALCILQDSPSDWEVESAKMGDIYSRAYLTVAATSAASADEGFLQNKKRQPELQIKWPDGTTARAMIDPVGGSGISSDDEPWNQRGWTFQEQILSKRLVMYSDKEVQWVCQCIRSCECGSVEEFANDRSSTSIWQIKSGTEAFAFWANLVSTYSARRLTVERDRLPALSGIASLIGHLTASSYLAGLWANDALQGLCWYRSTPASCFSAESYRAPTFSWVSLDGPVYLYGRDEDQDEKERGLMPRYIDAAVTVNGQNPFGVVSSGWIKIHAPLIPCTLRGTGIVLRGHTDIAANFDPDTELCNFSFYDADGRLQYSATRQYSSVTFKSDQPNESFDRSLKEYPEETLPAWLLYIGCRLYDQPQVDATRLLLVLGKSPRDPVKYERLGLLIVSPVFPIPIPEDSFETVTII